MPATVCTLVVNWVLEAEWRETHRYRAACAVRVKSRVVHDKKDFERLCGDVGVAASRPTASTMEITR